MSYSLNPLLIKLDATSRLYHQDIPIVGLTGGVATGKSTVSSLFEQDGLSVINADKLVHEIYRKNESVEFINKNFPQTIKKNAIDFKALRRVFFEKENNKKIIENFIYPRLEQAFMEKANNIKNLIIYDVPLLFEKNLAAKVDLVICVYCPENIQLLRLMHRDHMDEYLARTIISNQISIEEKKRLSDLIIDNSSSLENTILNYQKIREKIFN